MNRTLSLIAILIALSFGPFAEAQVPPEKCLSTFKVADGLQLELFAAEPMLINPTSIDVDHKGRVWVCEAVNYRRVNFNRPILRPEGDRIQVLIDETGDGKATKAVTFYQGKEIIAPLGIAVAPYPDGKGQRVYVCQSPDILVFEDKDGDLKADGPPRKLLSGFGGFDSDHGVHGINIGPDGKLYFTVGDTGVRNLRASDGKGPKFNSNSTDCRAGTVWRCDMDGTHLELIAHNFRNNYECCVNSFGEIWLSDNDDDGSQQTRVCYVMPGGNYGYHPRGPGQSHWHEEQPGIVHKVLRTGFGSPTGIVFYEGTLLPKKYQGQLLHCDAGPREFRCFHIKPKGAGYELEKELLVTSSDTWFRLSAVRVAPDGSVILADWYDPGVGGHGMGDWTRGRIYRLTPKGHKGYKVPEIDLTTDAGIVTAIKSPCLATRYQAFPALDSKKPLEALKVIAGRITPDDEPTTQARTIMHEIRISRNTRVPDPERPEGMLKLIQGAVKNQPLRLTVLRSEAMFERKTYDEGALEPNAARKMADSLTIVDAREMLLLIQKNQHKGTALLILELAKKYDGQDIFYLAALNIACGTDPARREAILADFEKHFPEWNDKVADLVWELRPRSMLPKMEKLLADAKLTAQQQARIVDIIAATDDPAAGQTMLAVLKSNVHQFVKNRAIESLKLFLPTKWKELKNGKQLDPTIDVLLKGRATQVAGLQLIAVVGAVERAQAVRALTETEFPLDVQDQALRTLTKLKCDNAVDALKFEARAGTVSPSPTFRVETAIRGLAAMITGQPKDEVGARAMAVLQELVASDSLGGWHARRVLALDALAGTRPGSEWLISLKEKGKLPTELDADAGKLLRNSPYQGLRNKALLLFPAPGKLDPRKLPPITVLSKRIGNADKGRQLLAASLKGETQCLRCHTVRGIGGNIGPDLSMIGKKASKENLFESILLPSKAIADQYLQWTIENSAGQKITGLLIDETPAAVTIRDANGKDTKIAKDDIEKRTKSLVSIMPEDIVKGFTEDELIDVVEYLFTLKTPSLTPEYWHIVGPFDNDAADKGLDTVYQPEKAKAFDLSATFKGKNGDEKWKTVRNNGSGYVDLMAHYAPDSRHIASYLYQQIESPADQEATILIGNDDGAKIWVNGELVFTNRDHFAATPERNKTAVKMKKGINTVLLKIVNGDGPHGFYFSIASEQELKLLPVK
jgi:putative membrane-bound dehydrogenase-like protein